MSLNLDLQFFLPFFFIIFAMQKDEVHNPNLCKLYFSTTLFTPKDNQLSAAAHFGMTGKYFSANAFILVPIYS